MKNDKNLTSELREKVKEVLLDHSENRDIPVSNEKVGEDAAKINLDPETRDRG